MPGTYASIAGVFLFYLLGDAPLIFVLATVLFLAAGFVFCGRAERLFGKKDCSYIVIDEVAGMLLGFVFIPWGIKPALVGLLLFRILDTLKPYPAGALQELNGSAGIMLDDITAGLYTNIILQLVFRPAVF